MKPPEEWDENYLLHHLPVGEFDWLEVKGRRGLDLTLDVVEEHQVRSNLSKALSAFANTGGGVIVFGMCDPQEEWSVDDGGVDLAAKGGIREWLEDIIPGLTDLPLERFNVYSVRGEPGSTAIPDGRGIVIIQVPDSERSPHQASDNRYYARVGGKSRPIGHRLVSDIANRRTAPILSISFYISWETRQFGVLGMGESKVLPVLQIRVGNTGRVMAEFVNLFVYVPAALTWGEEKFKSIETIDDSRFDSIYFSNQRDNAGPLKGATSYWFEPILPGRSIYREIQLSPDHFRFQDERFRVLWRAYADNAIVREGMQMLSDIPILNSESDVN